MKQINKSRGGYVSNKTSDKNVVNIEVIEDFILELKSFGLNKDTLEVANELENLLAGREQMLKAIIQQKKKKATGLKHIKKKKIVSLIC